MQTWIHVFIHDLGGQQAREFGATEEESEMSWRMLLQNTPDHEKEWARDGGVTIPIQLSKEARVFQSVVHASSIQS